MPEQKPPRSMHGLPITTGTEYTRAFIEAWIDASSRKKGRKVITGMMQRLANEDGFVAPIRPTAGHAEALKVHRDVIAVFSGHLPGYFEMLKG